MGHDASKVELAALRRPSSDQVDTWSKVHTGYVCQVVDRLV